MCLNVDSGKMELNSFPKFSLDYPRTAGTIGVVTRITY